MDLSSLPLEFKDATPGAFLVALIAGAVFVLWTKRPWLAVGFAITVFVLLTAIQIVGQSSPTPTPTPTPSLTPTPTPTPTPLPTDEAGCVVPSSVDWENHEPIADLSIDPTYGPCRTLMVSSRSLDVPGGPHCDNGTLEVCVLVVRHGQLRSDQEVTGLTPFSWYGLTTAIPVDAIRDKRIDTTTGWFSPDNCQGKRCNRAVVFTINADGTVHQDVFTGP